MSDQLDRIETRLIDIDSRLRRVENELAERRGALRWLETGRLLLASGFGSLVTLASTRMLGH